MPSRDEHLSKARLNKEFADSITLDNPTSVGWALTAIFYSALHYIEAYNAKYNFHCNNHNELNDNIRRNQVLSDICDDYCDLQTFSWNARYRAKKYGRQEVAEANEFHAAIEKHVMKLLGAA